MKNLKNLFLISCFIFVACSNKVELKKSDPSLQSSSLLGNWQQLQGGSTNCAVAFHISAETANERQFLIVNQFVTSCRFQGRASGIYFDTKYELIPISKIGSSTIPFRESMPASAFALALISERLDNRQAVGWYDIASESIAISDTSTIYMNGLTLLAKVVSGRLQMSNIRLNKATGDTPREALLDAVQVQPSYLKRETLWEGMALPAQAIVASDVSENNYLYCVGVEDPKDITMVDFKGNKYKVHDRKIGEIGSIASDIRGSQVYMARTDFGSYQTEGVRLMYSLSLTLVGGRNASAAIITDNSNYGYMNWQSYNPMLCRFLKNDIFRGIPGWNP